MNSDGVAALADSILYVSSLLKAGARRIDRCIDYFGESGTATPAGVFEDEAGGSVRIGGITQRSAMCGGWI
jgi:hypothetical protein